MNEEQCERLVQAFEKIAEWFENDRLSDALYDVTGAIEQISQSIDKMNDKEE